MYLSLAIPALLDLLCHIQDFHPVCKAVFTLRTTPDDIVRRRTMSSGVAEIEHIDSTSLLTYRTMSYIAATTLTCDTRMARQFTIRYDTIEEINVDSKAEYTA